MTAPSRAAPPWPVGAEERPTREDGRWGAGEEGWMERVGGGTLRAPWSHHVRVPLGLVAFPMRRTSLRVCVVSPAAETHPGEPSVLFQKRELAEH